MLGGSYYLGELNPSRHFAGVTNPAGGLIYRYNTNSRYALKFSALYGKLTADDDLFDIGLNNYRNLSFESSLLEFSGQLEFNFYPYGLRMSEVPYSPYIFCGLSGYRAQPQVESLPETEQTALAESYTGETVTAISFPFGFGMKFMLKGGLNIGLEWSIRKTFNDKLDGINNQYETGNVYDEPVQHRQLIGFQKGNPSNNDWYSFAGILITYRPGPKKNACPGIN